MSGTRIPSEAPPPYSETPAASKSSNSAAASSSTSTYLHPDRVRNGIPPLARRSMEDEGRPLPSGWERHFDAKSAHSFYVDTRANPPRSIWHHPHDDDQYLNTLTSEERERLQEMQRVPTHDDIVAMDSDEDDHQDHHSAQPSTSTASATAASASLPARPEKLTGMHKFGRKMKDKVTSSTHEEREAQRKKRALAEQRMYEQHQRYRQAMAKAMQTGEPQLLGKDKDGVDVYIQPPSASSYGGYGGLAGGGLYGGGLYGGSMYNPYSSGLYASPNSRYAAPGYPYERRYGYGYGGGLGLPLMGGLGGGLLLGGLLL